METMRLIFYFLGLLLLLECGHGCNETDFGTLNGTEGFETENKTIVKRKIADAQWGPWSFWSFCSKTCGGGVQTRTRTCRAAAGQSCSGQAKEERPCNEKPCPAQWSQWSEWSTCNNKEQSRNRTCTNGGQCNGPARETRQCRASSWSDWRPWSQCSATCGINGQQTRTRTCQGGNDCPNPETNVEKRPCQPQPPACVKWTQWSTWSACSRTCGNGEQSRNRSCVNEETNSTLTTALFSQCKGPNRETQKCNTGPCPTPKWSDWSDWGPCANGRQSRNRTCNGGTTCWGSATETRPCNGPAGGWQEWSQWSLCSKSCAGGEQTRQRKCSNGGPLGGKCPPGSANEKRPCNTQTCPSWGDWTWSGPCSVTCGNGVRRRSRTCNGGQGCIGVSEEVVACSNGACKN